MATSLHTRPRWFLAPVCRVPAPPQPCGGWLAPTLVLLAALALAGCLYIRFLGVDRALWYNPYHDRSAHYLYSLKLATAVEQGRVGLLLHDLNAARIWPPLHGMAAAVVLLAGGRDYRLAVLPSLAGWVATIVLGFLVARRAAPRGGTLAGLLAALLIAASPAHRAYATDIMLESLGAALSLLVLYCYLLTVQGRPEEPAKARCLALSLLLLFLEKYNYWLLVVLALLVAEALSRGHLYLAAARDLLSRWDWRRWMIAQLRQPLTWGIAVLLFVSAAVYLRGERPFAICGHSLALHPPHNVIHFAYVLLFVRLAVWWQRQGRSWARQLDNRWRQILLWLVCPVSVWFLLPKHPSYFLWYLSFADRAPHQHMDMLGGFRDYATWMVQDYHTSVAAALAAMGLCLLGLMTWRRLRPGGAGVLALLVLAAVLTPTHPNHKGRMLHSWLPALWVTAGLGAAVLMGQRALTTETQRHREEKDKKEDQREKAFPDCFCRSLPSYLEFIPEGRGSGGRGSCRAVFSAAGGSAGASPSHSRNRLLVLLSSLCLCASVVSASSLLGHAVEGGPHTEQPSMLDVTDAYLAEVERGGRTLLLTTLPLKPMAQWTWLERFGSFANLEERWYGFGAAGADNRRGFADWLKTTDCDTIVFCETTISREGVDSGPECDVHAELKDVLSNQQVFHLHKQKDLPHLACRVQIWRRCENNN